MLTAVVISPYLARNIIVLNEITLTKSIGFNLWKGNNPQTDVEGKNYIFDSVFDIGDINLKEKINKVPEDKYYEINLDKVFLNEGIKNIKNDPTKYFGLYLKKF